MLLSNRAQLSASLGVGAREALQMTSSRLPGLEMHIWEEGLVTRAQGRWLWKHTGSQSLELPALGCLCDICAPAETAPKSLASFCCIGQKPIKQTWALNIQRPGCHPLLQAQQLPPFLPTPPPTPPVPPRFTELPLSAASLPQAQSTHSRNGPRSAVSNLWLISSPLLGLELLEG